MKKKTISMVIVAIMSAMTVTSLSGCGTQTSATNVQISEENQNKTVVINEEEIVVSSESESDTELIGNEDLVFYDKQQGVGQSIVDLDSFIKLDDVELHFIADTDFYYTDGTVAGYIKSDAYVKFNGCKDQWVSFSPALEGTDVTTFLMNLEELEKNAVNENIIEEAPVLAEDITDGNIVLYGGEKYPDEYMPLDNNDIEETSIELTNVEADIPLYSGEGRLCGHLNEGGSIVLTGHCTPATGWYRFENPIEGTEYKYLYMLSHEIVMSYDEEEIIAYHLDNGRVKILEAIDDDMECYEFSVDREYNDVSKHLFCEEFNASEYRTFYIECSRNGDFFDCKVYYK